MTGEGWLEEEARRARARLAAGWLVALGLALAPAAAGCMPDVGTIHPLADAPPETSGDANGALDTDTTDTNDALDAALLDADTNDALDAVFLDADTDGALDAVLLDADTDDALDAVLLDADTNGALDADATCGDGSYATDTGGDALGCADCQVVESPFGVLLFCSTPATWEAARDHCEAMGAELLVADSRLVDEWVSSRLESYLGPNARAFFGLRRDPSPQAGAPVWIWDNGNGSTYRHWPESGPPQSGEAALLRPPSSLGAESGWEATTSAGEAHPFVCHRRVCQAPFLRLPGTTPASPHIYWACPGQPMSFESAEAHCQGLGGHLVTLADPAQANALTSREVWAPGPTWWVGARLVGGDMALQWVDESETYYDTLWSSPPSPTPPEGANCVTFRVTFSSSGISAQSIWETHDCTEQRAFLCEADVTWEDVAGSLAGSGVERLLEPSTDNQPVRLRWADAEIVCERAASKTWSPDGGLPLDRTKDGWHGSLTSSVGTWNPGLPLEEPLEVWLGATCDPSESGDGWRWLTGDPLQDPGLWVSGDQAPACAGSSVMCLAMSAQPTSACSSSMQDCNWTASPCDERQAVLCH